MSDINCLDKLDKLVIETALTDEIAWFKTQLPDAYWPDILMTSKMAITQYQIVLDEIKYIPEC